MIQCSADDESLTAEPRPQKCLKASPVDLILRRMAALLAVGATDQSHPKFHQRPQTMDEPYVDELPSLDDESERDCGIDASSNLA